MLLGWSVYILATLPPPHRKHDSDYLPESPETQNSSLPQAANQQSMATWGGPFGSVCMSVGIWAWSVRVSGRPLKVLPIESLAKRLEHTLPNTHTVVSGLPYPLVGRSLHFVVINYNWATRVVLLFAGMQAYPLPHYNSRIRNEVIILLDAAQTAGLMKRTYMDVRLRGCPQCCTTCCLQHYDHVVVIPMFWFGFRGTKGCHPNRGNVNWKLTDQHVVF